MRDKSQNDKINSLKMIKELEDEIESLERKIKEKELNLPAHSVKPGMIKELEDLEEELSDKRKMLERLLYKERNE